MSSKTTCARTGATAAPPESADVVVVNTCSVTASADQSARQTIRRIARVNPSVRVVVTGCYASRRPDEVCALPNVVRVVENDGKESLVASVSAEFGLATAERFGGGDGPCGRTLEPGIAGRTALTLRVQTGCEERCSYCIIPQTRGASRSRPLNHVLRDVEHAGAAGYKEIVDDRRAPGILRSRFARWLLSGAICSERLRQPAGICDSASALSSLWTARTTSSEWLRHRQNSRLTSTYHSRMARTTFCG